jgi:phosphatidate cytidylyltransferase
MPFFLHPLLGESVNIEPMQFHILAMATFASLVAPFGGFFASGLKRTFKIKDFGDLVPGHGGMTDRMDCQFTMGFFAYLYYQSFIAQYSMASVGSVLETVVNSLSPDEQVEVLERLARYLIGRGVIQEKV